MDGFFGPSLRLGVFLFPNGCRFYIIAGGENLGSEFPVPSSQFACPHGPHPFRSQPDRLSAHRRSPHGAVQLAVCPAAWRAILAADRRYRRRAQRRGGPGPHSARLSLAGDRLGRRARGGGPYEPYYQSQRLAGYQAAAKKLLEGGFAYRDFATADEIQAEREAAQAEKRPFLYSRRWMAETEEQAAKFAAEGRPAVVRLKMPREGTLLIDDKIRGQVAFDWAREQDHVIQRADGTCLYHLASVVDDYDFQITHVIRAEEHLSNTPRQIFIAQSLGYPLPVYAHLPFVAEPGSKNKLSKRKLDKYLKNRDFAQAYEHGQAIAAALGLTTSADTFNPVIVDFYEQVGYLPDAIINYLALLGWSLDDKTEFLDAQQMIENFSLERVVKAPASFDPKKLWSFQDHYMQQLPLKQKVAAMLRYLQQAGLVPSPAAMRGGAEADADCRSGRRSAEGVRRHLAVRGFLLSRPDRVRRAGVGQKLAQAGCGRTGGRLSRSIGRARRFQCCYAGNGADRIRGRARHQDRRHHSRPARSHDRQKRRPRLVRLPVDSRPAGGFAADRPGVAAGADRGGLRAESLLRRQQVEGHVDLGANADLAERGPFAPIATVRSGLGHVLCHRVGAAPAAAVAPIAGVTAPFLDHACRADPAVQRVGQLDGLFAGRLDRQPPGLVAQLRELVVRYSNPCNRLAPLAIAVVVRVSNFFGSLSVTA